MIDVIIAGPYVEELNDNKGIRGSSNQVIVVHNHSLDDRYLTMNSCHRNSQNFLLNKMLVSVGIPLAIDKNGK